MLEDALGSQLFDRTADGYALSQSGEEFFVTAERVEDELFVAQRKIAGRDAGLRGAIRVSLPFAVMHGLLAAEIAAFADQYPHISLEIEVTDRFSDLAQRAADVSIRLTHEVTDDVVGRRLSRYSKAIYASPGFLERLCEPDQKDHRNRCWLGWGGNDSDTSWVRETPYPTLPVRHNLPTHLLQMEAAKTGMGLSMLPCFLGDQEPGLRRVPGSVPVLDRSVWLLLHGDLRNMARVRAFVDFIAGSILKYQTLLDGDGAVPGSR